MKDPARESLDARLAKLPPDIVPPRYLWPSIEREIERQPLRTPQVVLAAAAAVAALMIAGAVVWAVLHSRAATNAPGAPNIAMSLDEPHDPGYLAARAGLVDTFRQRLAHARSAHPRQDRGESRRDSPGARRHPQGAGRGPRTAPCSSSCSRAPGTTSSTCTTT